MCKKSWKYLPKHQKISKCWCWGTSLSTQPASYSAQWCDQPSGLGRSTCLNMNSYPWTHISLHVAIRCTSNIKSTVLEQDSCDFLLTLHNESHSAAIGVLCHPLEASGHYLVFTVAFGHCLPLHVYGDTRQDSSSEQHQQQPWLWWVQAVFQFTFSNSFFSEQ